MYFSIKNSKHRLLIFFILLVNAAAAQDTNFFKLPVPTGHLNDFEEILMPDEAITIEHFLDSLDKKQGLQVAVITTKHFFGYKTIDDFAMNIGNKWGVGHKDKNDGVILVISITRRSVYIATGSGIEAKLPPEKLTKVIDNTIIPLLKQVKFDQAILEGVKKIQEVLKN